MKKHLPAIVCGFGAGVMQIVPIAKSLSCCIIIPVAVVLAIALDRKANNIPNDERTETSKAAIIGVLTGIFAAIFGSFLDIFITLITKNNDIIAAFPEIQNMLGNFPISETIRNEVIDMFQGIITQIQQTGFSAIYALSITINNLIVNTIFGLLGGLVGVQIINSKIPKERKQ